MICTKKELVELVRKYNGIVCDPSFEIELGITKFKYVKRTDITIRRWALINDEDVLTVDFIYKPDGRLVYFDEKYRPYIIVAA